MKRITTLGTVLGLVASCFIMTACTNSVGAHQISKPSAYHTCTARQLDGTPYQITTQGTCPQYMQCVLNSVTYTVLKNPQCPTSIGSGQPN